MNIQIFGTSKSFDTKKAQRWFSERGIRVQYIDLKEKEMSRGEFDNVKQAVGGYAALIDSAAKDKQTLALLECLVEYQREDKLFENQHLLKTPIVRSGRKAAVGTLCGYENGDVTIDDGREKRTYTKQQTAQVRLRMTI